MLFLTVIPTFIFTTQENPRSESDLGITFAPIFVNFDASPVIGEVVLRVTINDVESSAIRQGSGELASS